MDGSIVWELNKCMAFRLTIDDDLRKALRFRGILSWVYNSPRKEGSTRRIVTIFGTTEKDASANTPRHFRHFEMVLCAIRSEIISHYAKNIENNE